MTAAPRRLRPRKQPTQQRAADTRERILGAAARVFARHGYAAGTTNRIAAVASLSIGSLYQYFPNKDAILVELVRRHIAAGRDLLEHRLSAAGLPDRLDERLGMFVDVMIDNHAGSPQLHRVLFEEAPRPPSLLAELRQLESETIGVVEGMLRRDRQVVVEDPAMAARLVVIAIESLVHRYITGGQADELDLATFRAEVIAMLTNYLTGPRPALNS